MKRIELEGFSWDFDFRFEPDLGLLCESINEIGLVKPIILCDGSVISGYSRLRAAKKLGIDELPVLEKKLNNLEDKFKYIYYDNLNDESDLIDYSRLINLFMNLGLEEDFLINFNRGYELRTIRTIAEFPKDFLRLARKKRLNNDVMAFLASLEEDIKKFFIYLGLSQVKLTVPGLKELNTILKIGSSISHDKTSEFIRKFSLKKTKMSTLKKIKEKLEIELYPADFNRITKIKKVIQDYNERLGYCKIKDYNEDSGEFILEMKVRLKSEIPKLIEELDKYLKDYLSEIEQIYQRFKSPYE